MPKFSVLVILLVLQGCAAGNLLVEKVNRFKDMEADIIVPNVDEPYTTDIAEALNIHGVDGATVVTLEGGVVLARGHYGYEDKFNNVPTDEDTLYQAASLSKMIAGLGMAKAHRTTGPVLGRKLSKHSLSHTGRIVQWWDFRTFAAVGEASRSKDVTMRGLLQNTAGLDTPTTGTSCHSGDTSITGIMGLPGHLNCVDCVKALNKKPGTKWKYSSGGFVVAEAIFLEHTGIQPEDFLDDEILSPYGFRDSTFKDGSISIANLARGCDEVNSSGLCSCPVEKAEVKFPGGLLANPLEYAGLLALILNDGKDSDGNTVIELADLHEVMTPAHHIDSSLQSCSMNSDCANDEVCLQSQCVLPLKTGHKGLGFYGLGVHMSSTTLSADGFPRELSHTGGQDGFSSYFHIDRLTGNGIVIMMNGPAGGKIKGRKPLLNAIIDSYERHY